MRVCSKVMLATPKERSRTRHLLSPGKKVKTTMCHSVTEGVRCSFGMRCKYAHNVHELRSRKVNPRYRSQPCREYNYLDSSTYLCYHGDVCSFQHIDDDIDEVRESILKNYHALTQMIRDRYNEKSNRRSSISNWTSSSDFRSDRGFQFSP